MECYKDFKTPYFLRTCRPQTWASWYGAVPFVLQLVYTLHLREGIHILHEVFFTDEACFHFGDNITRQNSRIWSAENLETFCVRFLRSLKIQIWCVVSLWRTVGAIFLRQMLTVRCYPELWISYPCCKCMNKTASFNKMRSWPIQQLPQCGCYLNIFGGCIIS
jgi:hypothetical protein